MDSNQTAIVRQNILEYLGERPALLSVLRAKEAFLFQSRMPFETPVLDIGCGDGFFAHVVLGGGNTLPKGKPVRKFDAGLDVEGSRIDQAELRGTYKKVVTYDGVHMPFADNSFATIISNSTLEHIPRLPDVLKEIHRILKPGGKFMTTVIAKPWADHYFGNMFAGRAYSTWMTRRQAHINLYAYDEWKRAFRKTGFHIREEIGHASPQVSTWTDIFHYCGIPNLVSYTILGKWVILPSLAKRMFPVSYFTEMACRNVHLSAATALFFVLSKK